MTTPEKLAKMQNNEIKISARYRWFFKLFIITTLILVILLVLSAIGIIFLDLGTNWFLFGFVGWVIGLSLLIGLFILLEILFYLHFFLLRKKRVKLGMPQPEYIDGKKVIEITFPRGTDGGIYSKTYIEIDSNNVLRLKNLMIPPDELW
ncbi:MAG: hypothetical protein AYK22_03225 [Thermoplasmatales archaeon SG8-52-3]|nr:MAG: hypothetical protein AYK22_03225 [Thermoplasmatales archaeon SG8-52-3]